MKTPDELLNKHAKIQPNELRIGNWLKGIGHNIIWKIEGVHEDFIFSSNAWRILSSFEPIPLTEEWLLKFGFENSILSHIYTKGMISINIGNHFTIMVNGKAIRQIDNHYVHTLQNLYFAIEQEELIYTP